MFTIFFWIVILIIGVLSAIYLFLLTNSISTKAHNHPEAKKVVLAILVSSLLGFLVFGWNTFSLFNSLNNLGAKVTLPSIDNSGTQSSTPSTNNSNNNSNNKDTGGYTNF
jgi:glucan phosphoethanolaminetransferase (alkaline phosphatase superfamily)